MTVIGKFQVQVITQQANSDAIQIELAAVTNDGTPENERFHKYTPNGTIKLWVDNPPASSYFRDHLGKPLYVNFSDA